MVIDLVPDIRTVLVFITTFLLTFVYMRPKTSSDTERDISRRKARMPPGPTGIPVFGNLFSLGNNPHLTFIEMAKKYGNVFTIKLGSESIVVLNGFQAVRDALVKQGQAFAGRPKMTLTEELTKGKGIVAADYGETWKRQRKFTLQMLKELGMGKPAMGINVSAELESLTEAFNKLRGQPFEVDSYLEVSIANIVCSVVFGTRYEYNDPQLLTLLRLVNRFCEIGTKAAAMNFFPFLKYMPFGPIKEVFTNNDIMTQYVKSVIQQHKETFTPGNSRDFIDAYLAEIQKQNNNLAHKGSSFTEEYLFYLLNDLFFAGTETMSVTLRWAILYMIVHEDVQKKVQEELDEVVGKDSLPSLTDRPHLPYTEATMMEIQRMANITSLTFPHKTLDDVELYDYIIPKDTSVFVNLYSVHVDETQWPEPQKFNPGRFLDENGSIRQRLALMPFSAGQRRCPGEELARAELFLFFSGLMHRFSFKSADETSKPTIEKASGISLVPYPYKLYADPRH
ncbi:cytochrome P450 2U1-like [Saccoglossus kowalevskii]|uniref:Cytochrome P450 2U1-like n=1 Tax=Saccoglossus kowalevskii TaxID=10224 RepID=A0ABM0MPV0_SACKO|nr:PREDICTED: cytochrome P450 2U1-like [Saccoglossus kowalevskii]